MSGEIEYLFECFPISTKSHNVETKLGNLGAAVQHVWFKKQVWNKLSQYTFPNFGYLNKFPNLISKGTSWAPLERNSRSLIPSVESLLKESMISYVAAAIVRLTVPVSSITYSDCGSIAIGQRESTEFDL